LALVVQFSRSAKRRAPRTGALGLSKLNSMHPASPRTEQ
jgi:hypothetical protein